MEGGKKDEVEIAVNYISQLFDNAADGGLVKTLKRLSPCNLFNVYTCSLNLMNPGVHESLSLSLSLHYGTSFPRSNNR